MAKDSLSITDNRTGKSYELPVSEGTIRAMDLRQIKVADDDFGLMTYDPAFMNTASCRSAITFIDGDKGILRYRGYPIEQLAEKCSFLEVAYLLCEGELPTKAQLEAWEEKVAVPHLRPHQHHQVPGGLPVRRAPDGDAPRRGRRALDVLPRAKHIGDPANRYLQRIRLIAKMPTIAAFAFRHSRGLPFVFPRNDLSYIGNFVNMTFEIGGKLEPNAVLQRALEILFILHADHEQNCSTSAVRAVGSSEVDPFSAVVGGHRGPLRPAARRRQRGRAADARRDRHARRTCRRFIDKVKSGARRRLMGFGHRVYKSYDPRAKLIKKVAYDVFEQTGLNPKLEIALELERIALEDEYFIKRKLYPNVDFYSGLIYQAMGYPDRTTSRCCSRSAGCRAGWRSGRRCCSTRSRRSPGRARSTWARRSGTSCRWWRGSRRVAGSPYSLPAPTRGASGKNRHEGGG